MGLLLGYSILNLPSMIISCCGSTKKTFLDRRVKGSNNQNDDKKDAIFLRSHTRKTDATATILMDTRSGGRGKNPPQKLTTKNVHQAILV